jgi:glycogen synthase
MKVLMTADAVGGVWTYALDLARGLDRYGIEVTLATMGPLPSDAQRDEVRSCRNVRLVAGDYRLEWMDDPWPDVAGAGEWLLALEQDTRPDVVHLNGYAHAALPWAAPVMVAAHSCVCSWWRAVHGCEAPAEWNRYRDAVAAGFAAADLVAAPTATILDELIDLHGAPRRSLVIPNGRDMDRLPLGARDAFGRYARTTHLPAPLILAAGRLWDPAKNMTVLAAAAQQLAWPVYVAGSAQRPGGATQPLTGLHHLGNLAQPALRHWYSRAAIFVHPVLYEPFGLAPLEAALCGAALVLSDIPTLREVWGDAAVYVPPRDSHALATALKELIDDPAQLARRAEAALQQARTMTSRRMAAGYYEAYRQLQPLRATRVPAGATACAS